MPTRRAPKVGQRVRARWDIWDPLAKGWVPKGSEGVVIAAGPDAAYGFANVRWDDVDGVTDGLPVSFAGPNPAAEVLPA